MSQTTMRTLGLGLAALGVIIGFAVPTNVCSATVFRTVRGCVEAPSPIVAILTWTLLVAGAVLVGLALQARGRR